MTKVFPEPLSKTFNSFYLCGKGGGRRPMWQSLCKKARFVFGRDCRVALRAPRNDEAIHTAQCTIAVELFWEPPRRRWRHPSEGGEFLTVGDFSTTLEMTWVCAFGMREDCAWAFLCLVEIAASRFALLAMTKQCTMRNAQLRLS
ncbi:MAG: hypothetical protein LBL66_03440 [Clostridiales bacterium]|nr:hypothetical protein [Clostridiales bacterium]